MLEGRVLITGGAGFLARAIYRRARAEGWPAQFTCLSRDDAKHAALQARYPEVACVLGDVAGMGVQQMAHLFRGYDLVIHAAAQKYVDRSEHHAWDTVRVNVEGSRDVAMAAMYASVPKVVGISTDKACLPVNTYGASKMLMERLFQEADSRSETQFVLCRYGNVVGSTGSVIPLFVRWAAAAQPIKVTNPAMTRFWMSPNEAVDTVVQAATNARGGTITIPQMRAMEMRDLALAILRCEDEPWDTMVKIGRVEIIGERPGEKMHETIVAPHEAARMQPGALAGATWASLNFMEIGTPTSPWTSNDLGPVTSEHPPGGTLPANRLRTIVADAETI